MRKEVVWAIIAGIGFGLVIAFGVARISSTLKLDNKKVEASPTPKSVVAHDFEITLDTPEDEDVITENTVKVSGITKDLSWITISSEEEDYMIQADEKGFFSEEVDLVSGVNQIKVTAFDPSGQESVERVLVVYSSTFESEDEESSATESSSLIESVEKRVQNILNRPKAYLGTVTDIADSTIQVRTKSGEIKQISTDKEDINVFKQSGTKNTAVKFTDVAIGDFIVAMGFKNANSVLSAKQIMITPAITEPTTNSYLSKITTVGLKDINLTTIKDGQDKKITPSRNTLIYVFKDGELTKIKMANLEEEAIMVFVNDESEDSVTTRTIFLISQN